jgi:hypothetical protein
MASLAKVCVALAVLCFILAVIGAFTGPIWRLAPHTYSQGTIDLALIALCLSVVFKDHDTAA